LIACIYELEAKSDRVQMVFSYVKENLKADLSVESLAEVANLSSRQLVVCSPKKQACPRQKS
jgi:transcriptional regulator GlxA family with amidase domain